jgi:hypothetical protein
MINVAVPEVGVAPVVVVSATGAAPPDVPTTVAVDASAAA